MLSNANAKICTEKALNLKNFVKFNVTVTVTVTTKLCHERGSAS